MLQKLRARLTLLIFAIVCGSKHLDAASVGATTESALSAFDAVTIISDVVRAQFEHEALVETKAFLNGMFQSQIDYFGKVKLQLPVASKRVQDIGKYIARLQLAIQTDDIEQKDQMWRDTFIEFSDSAFLLNRESDTQVSNARYREILADCGLETVTQKFFIDVATYFWKMAKASGKAVEMTVGEQLEKWKQL